MLVIRLFRIGKKNQPSFKIIVADKKNPAKGGELIEEVGFWNPFKKEKVLKPDRIKYWLSVGAKPSASVNNLLIPEKIIEGKKIPKQKKPKKKEEKPASKKTEKVEKPVETTKKADEKEAKPAEKAAS